MELEMRNLKTKDLPKMFKIIDKLDLKVFIKETMEMMYEEDVDEEILESLKGKTEEEQKKILDDARDDVFAEIAFLMLDKVIDGYGVVYEDLNDFVAGLYGLKLEEVEDLDLDIFFECIYKLKDQEKLINFFKTALK